MSALDVETLIIILSLLGTAFVCGVLVALFCIWRAYLKDRRMLLQNHLVIVSPWTSEYLPIGRRQDDVHILTSAQGLGAPKIVPSAKSFQNHLVEAQPSSGHLSDNDRVLINLELTPQVLGPSIPCDACSTHGRSVTGDECLSSSTSQPLATCGQPAGGIPSEIGEYFPTFMKDLTVGMVVDLPPELNDLECDELTHRIEPNGEPVRDLMQDVGKTSKVSDVLPEPNGESCMLESDIYFGHEPIASLTNCALATLKDNIKEISNDNYYTGPEDEGVDNSRNWGEAGSDSLQYKPIRRSLTLDKEKNNFDRAQGKNDRLSSLLDLALSYRDQEEECDTSRSLREVCSQSNPGGPPLSIDLALRCRDQDEERDNLREACSQSNPGGPSLRASPPSDAFVPQGEMDPDTSQITAAPSSSRSDRLSRFLARERRHILRRHSAREQVDGERRRRRQRVVRNHSFNQPPSGPPPSYERTFPLTPLGLPSVPLVLDGSEPPPPYE